MSTEYVIEIEDFELIEEAEAWASKNIKKRDGKQINVVSRDITVIEI